jgi:NAD(P)H dehydrogenase (quinone)
MQDVNVVVVFYSRCGSTERLALAAAVGAVQGRANIRLRKLPDTADAAVVESIQEWNENRARMDREYVAPRESDAAWADAILAGMPAEETALCAEFQKYFESLESLRAQGKLEGKLGASFTQGLSAAPLYAAINRAGLISVPEMQGTDALEAARLQGRRVAEAARSLRSASTAK